MDFKFESGINADDQVVELRGAAGSGDFEDDFVQMFDAVKFGIVWRHVNMAGGADDAVFHFQHPLGAHDVSAGGAFDVAGHADGDVDAKLDSVGEGEFHLGEVSGGAEDAEIGDDSFAGSDEGDGLIGGELSILVEPLVHGQLGTGAEENFQVFRGNVHVAGGAVDQEGWALGRAR